MNSISGIACFGIFHTDSTWRVMPHFLYKGPSTAVTLDSGSVVLVKNSAVTLPADSEWVKRHIALKSLVELPKETKAKPTPAELKKTSSKGSK